MLPIIEYCCLKSASVVDIIMIRYIVFNFNFFILIFTLWIFFVCVYMMSTKVPKNKVA